MDEASKTRSLWTPWELSLLQGRGIDIGAGPDPVLPTVQRFDQEHGDANRITQFVDDQFDFVFSSHCLEHMHDPAAALQEWWRLVKPGGVLFFLVPDEDLYEQGVFPSRFNPDHKATFTISKRHSWSPKSFNVVDLCSQLPASELLSIQLHDIGYDRQAAVFGKQRVGGIVWRIAAFGSRAANRLLRSAIGKNVIAWPSRPVDQTRTGALAQIQTIVRKQLGDKRS